GRRGAGAGHHGVHPRQARSRGGATVRGDMERRSFGGTGAAVPAIGQGTWMLEKSDRRGAVATLRRGLDLGLVHIDTAELYGNGGVEELVGEAIAGHRDRVYLVSKVRPHNASAAGTVTACERSLRRL